jgi:xanthine dehydrogenase YagR molybdenum-binding subunit
VQQRLFAHFAVTLTRPLKAVESFAANFRSCPLSHGARPADVDIHAIETMFVEEDDKIVKPLGFKGMGELGMVGIPAAIANAVFHATGRRVRVLPITPDKLL